MLPDVLFNLPCFTKAQATIATPPNELSRVFFHSQTPVHSHTAASAVISCELSTFGLQGRDCSIDVLLVSNCNALGCAARDVDGFARFAAS